MIHNINSKYLLNFQFSKRCAIKKWTYSLTVSIINNISKAASTMYYDLNNLYFKIYHIFSRIRGIIFEL